MWQFQIHCGGMGVGESAINIAFIKKWNVHERCHSVRNHLASRSPSKIVPVREQEDTLKFCISIHFPPGSRWRRVQNVTFRQLYPRNRKSTPTEQESEWAPETVWTFWYRENPFAPTRIGKLYCLDLSRVTVPTELSADLYRTTV